MVVADLSYNTDVFQAGESIIDKEVLSQIRVECGEIVISSRDARGISGVGMKGLPIDPL